MSTEPLVIVNQIDPAFGAFLRGLDCAPTVIDTEPLPDGHPLYTHQKVMITPHVSYVGAPEVERFQAKVAANLRAFLAGTEMTDVLVHARGY